jgi:hypothetical protein
MQLENGTYPARPTGRVEVGEHANGCLICAMEFAMEGGATISNTFWITSKDGAVNTRNVETLKKLFGWDGTDPFWLADHGNEMTETDVELVIENETFVGKDGKDHTNSKVKWVNAPGGGMAPQVANNDRKSLLAKYGAKLRAVSGGTPSAAPKKPTAPPPAPAKKDSPPPKAPAKSGKVYDMNTCWKALTDAMADKPRAAIEDQWFDVLKEVHGDKAQDDYTAEDWGAVMEKLKDMFDNLPF